jgi:hypothetical protein
MLWCLVGFWLLPPALALCSYLFVVVRSIGKTPRDAQAGMPDKDLRRSGAQCNTSAATRRRHHLAVCIGQTLAGRLP